MTYPTVPVSADRLTLEHVRDTLAAIDPAALPVGGRIAWCSAVAALHQASTARAVWARAVGSGGAW